MRAVVSVSIPEDLASELKKFAKETGRAKSELVKEALKAYLWEERLKKLRRALTAKAKAKGFVTDEDVFKAVS